MKELEIWTRAQKEELGFWASLGKRGITLPPESLDRFKKCLNLLPLHGYPGTRILDVGSGPNGGIASVISGQSFKVAIDPLMGKGNISKEDLKRINPIQAMGEYLPLVKTNFDAIFCINVLDHSYYPLKILTEISRVINKRGIFILMVHIVTPLAKLVHSIFHRTSFGKILVQFRMHKIPIFSRALFLLDKFFARIFRVKIIIDGITHPFYFTSNDVASLLEEANLTINKIETFPSIWKYKKELFAVARKAEPIIVGPPRVKKNNYVRKFTPTSV